MIQARFSTEKISSNSMEAFALNQKSQFGEKQGEHIEYSLAEALFLLKEKKMAITHNDKPLSFNEIVRRFSKIDKRIESKLVAFSDLRKKGYVVKTALKYGADFRVYPKGIKVGKDHSKWILFVVKENDQLKWHDFAAKNRVAHSTKKNLLIAIVDEESSVSYYEVSWQRT